MPLVNVNDLLQFFVQERSNSYYCCDVFEQGFGYLFTDCGGKQVTIVKEKIGTNSSKAVES